MLVSLLFKYNFLSTEAVKPTVEISGRVYVSGGDLVDMHVGDNLTAILTTPVKINCTARGIPKPKMTWKMNGQQLGNGGNYKTDNNGALAIKGVQDPGEFKCIAENFVGQDDASSFISLLGMFCMCDSFPKEMMGDKKSSIPILHGYQSRLGLYSCVTLFKAHVLLQDLVPVLLIS